MNEGYGGAAKKASMQVMAGVLGSPTVYKISGKLGRGAMRLMPWAVGNNLNPWYKGGEMPKAPKQSFSEWYKQNRTT